MSNTDAPFGFRSVTMAGAGAAPTGGLITRKCAAAGASIYQGDALVEGGSGYLIPMTASGSLSPVGVLQGVEYTNTQGDRIFADYYVQNSALAGSEVLLRIIPCDQGSLFAVRGYGDAIGFADIGAVIDIHAGTAVAAGSHGRSGMYVDQSTLGTDYTSSGPFTVKGLYSDYAASTAEDGCDNTAVNNIVIVAPNFGNQTGV